MNLNEMKMGQRLKDHSDSWCGIDTPAFYFMKDTIGNDGHYIIIEDKGYAIHHVDKDDFKECFKKNKKVCLTEVECDKIFNELHENFLRDWGHHIEDDKEMLGGVLLQFVEQCNLREINFQKDLVEKESDPNRRKLLALQLHDYLVVNFRYI